MSQLVRTNSLTGAVFRDGNVGTVVLQRQRIAWTCTDNLGMTRRQARATARLWTGGEGAVLEVGHYRFELVDADIDPRPCRGVNGNVCVAEGCFGEACRLVRPS